MCVRTVVCVWTAVCVQKLEDNFLGIGSLLLFESWAPTQTIRLGDKWPHPLSQLTRFHPSPPPHPPPPHMFRAFFETGSHCVNKAVFKLTDIYLSLPPKGWGERPVLSY